MRTEAAIEDEDRQIEAELRALSARIGKEKVATSLLMVPLVTAGAEPNAALTLATCRRMLRGVLREGDVFPLLWRLEKVGIFERVPGHVPAAWRTVMKA